MFVCLCRWGEDIDVLLSSVEIAMGSVPVGACMDLSQLEPVFILRESQLTYLCAVPAYLQVGFPQIFNTCDW